MHYSKWLNLGAFVIFTLFPVLGAGAEGVSTVRCVSDVLQERLSKATGTRALYQPILSTDMDFLRDEARFAEGPAPQKNTAIVAPVQQFRFNGETKAILELKKRLVSRYGDRIIAVQKGHSADILNAVREQFRMMLAELPETNPQVFRRDGDTLVNLLTGDRLSEKDLSIRDARKALEKLGQLVPDDLVFMKKKGDDYHLIGGNLAFPTHWSVGGALGETMTQIHSNLAGGPEKAAAFSAMLNRILDRTLASPEVVRRNNWFLELDPRYPLPSYQTTAFDAPSTITKKNYRNAVFLRTERQTLRGLPQSGTVVFGIQPMVFPLGQVLEDPNVADKLIQGIHVKLLPTRDNPSYVARVAQYLDQDVVRDPGVVQTRVVSSSPVDDSSYILRVEKPAGLDIVPGEAVRVTLGTPTGKQTRILSLASSPTKDYLEFAVKKSESDFKQAFQTLKPGDDVKLELTRTSLGFRPDKPAVMIAGGIGITPFRSFIQYAKDKKLDTPMWLFYGNRRQAPFEEELADATEENHKLGVTFVKTRPDVGWQGEKGRIDEDFLKRVVPGLPSDAIYYVVASPEMAESTRASLSKLGIPENRISIEEFPGYESKSADGEKPKVNPAKIPDGQTVCYCHRVSAGELRTAVDDGATTLDAIKDKTKAATGCGGCACNVMGIIECQAAFLN
jgi:ferredoxin-NADP reductase